MDLENNGRTSTSIINGGVVNVAATASSSSPDDYDDDKSLRGGLLHTVVKWLESLRVPMCCLSNKDNKQQQIRTPIIQGLERVVFGTQAAADVVTIVGMNPPRYLCYMLSGSLCDVIQFIIDVALHFALHLQDPSLCWAIGFFASISFRHTSHRYLVFGDYIGGYWSSLGRMYAGYSIIIVLSTIFNFIMTRYAKLPHYVAWIITLLWTGIVNYFILKRLWTFGGGSGDNKHKKDTEIASSELSANDEQGANTATPSLKARSTLVQV